MDISGVIYADMSSYHEVNYLYDITFAKRETGDLTLQLLLPSKSKTHKVFPLVIDVPGSGWGGADGHRHVPALTCLAEAGIAVACISYRGTFRDKVRVPAAVQDLNEAIRFMRKNADRFGIDPDRIALLGDSSGGHTVILSSLTSNRPEFTIGENTDIDASVKACVAFYAPNDFHNLVSDRIAEGKKLRPGEGEFPFEGREMYGDAFFENPEENLTFATASTYIKDAEKLVPYIFIQGDEDGIIPMAQGIRFCDEIRKNGGRAEFYKIAGAGHGYGCWTPEVMTLIKKFLGTYL